MYEQKRIRDYGIVIGEMKPGTLNSITDINGVKVGHCTIDAENIKTGVTAIIPCSDNIFRNKMLCACHVINGFGKTTGTIQIEELGTLETPIILTNTLSVGTAYDALVEYMLLNNKDIGYTTGTVNPVICECNDQYLNDIRGRHVKKENIFDAINNADVNFKEGAVGAGTGMSCYGLKGGIGTASRIIDVDGKSFTLGTLIMSNFGVKRDLAINGMAAGKLIDNMDNKKADEGGKGSIIIIISTDIPMTERQLKRVARRAAVGLARTGSIDSNGSGEIVIAFTTANRIDHYEKNAVTNVGIFNEDYIDLTFRAVAECTEESVLNSMICADTTMGNLGHVRYSLKEYIKFLSKKFDLFCK